MPPVPIRELRDLTRYRAALIGEHTRETNRLQKVLEDAANRKLLWQRLQFALDGEPDPWFEHAKANVDLRQFKPLAGEVTTA